MKTLTSHGPDRDDMSLVVQAEGTPDADGMYSKYAVSAQTGALLGHVSFQRGAIENGVPNGVSVAALLAICKDYLEAQQASATIRSQCLSRALECIDDALGLLT